MLTGLAVVYTSYSMGVDALFTATPLLVGAATCGSVWLHFDPYDGCHVASSGIVDAESGTLKFDVAVQQRPIPAKIRHSE